MSKERTLAYDRKETSFLTIASEARWERGENTIRCFSQQATDARLSFPSREIAVAVEALWHEYVIMSASKESIAGRLQAIGVPNPLCVVDKLKSIGFFVAHHFSDADQARSFHSLSERKMEVRTVPTGEALTNIQDYAEALECPRGEAFRLPTPKRLELSPLLTAGRSGRVMNPDSIALETISTLLATAFGLLSVIDPEGEHPHWRSTVASAGALYPLRIVCYPRELEFSPRPVAWQYHRILHAVEPLPLAKDAIDSLHKLLFSFPPGASIFLGIYADLQAAERKYGDHAYRFALIEAGSVLQNLRLACPLLNLENLPLGGAYEKMLFAAHEGRLDRWVNLVNVLLGKVAKQ